MTCQALKNGAFEPEYNAEKDLFIKDAIEFNQQAQEHISAKELAEILDEMRKIAMAYMRTAIQNQLSNLNQ